MHRFISLLFCFLLFTLFNFITLAEWVRCAVSSHKRLMPPLQIIMQSWFHLKHKVNSQSLIFLLWGNSIGRRILSFLRLATKGLMGSTIEINHGKKYGHDDSTTGTGFTYLIGRYAWVYTIYQYKSSRPIIYKVRYHILEKKAWVGRIIKLITKRRSSSVPKDFRASSRHFEETLSRFLQNIKCTFPLYGNQNLHQ